MGCRAAAVSGLVRRREMMTRRSSWPQEVGGVGLETFALPGAAVRTELGPPEPIEDLLLYHFYPGARVSALNPGRRPVLHHVGRPRVAVVRDADAKLVVWKAVTWGCQALALRWPHVGPFEVSVALEGASRGLKNILVVEGFRFLHAMEFAIPFVDAAVIELRPGRREGDTASLVFSVLDQAAALRASGCWVEVMSPVLPAPGVHAEGLGRIARFLVQSLGPDTPWHLTLAAGTEDGGLLDAAAEAARREGLRYVYVHHEPGYRSNTACVECGATLIERRRVARGFDIVYRYMRAASCPRCGEKLAGAGLAWDAGVWDAPL